MKGKHDKTFSNLTVVAALGAAIATACAPAPRRELSVEDRTADMYWLYSQFNEYYGPLEYKQARFGFNYEELKRNYLQRATETRNNNEFYKLMYQFISEFKDAHVSGSMDNSRLPARSTIAYLGFSGKRVGNVLEVTDLLPTSKRSPNYPIKMGDKIKKLNGVTLPEVVNTEMKSFRDLGHDEGNLTIHMNKIFTRTNLSNGLPTGDDATLTVERDGTDLTVVLPWVKKDLMEFNREQAAASRGREAPQDTDDSVTNIANRVSQSLFQLGFLNRSDGRISARLPELINFVRGLPEFNYLNTFKFIDDSPTWSYLDNTIAQMESSTVASEGTRANGPRPTTANAAEDLLRRSREVPSNATIVSAATVYPAYYKPVAIMNAAGQSTGMYKNVGYIYLHSFSVPDRAALSSFAATLQIFQSVGVSDIVIDMINNGGGSLDLGMKLAQMLSKDKVVQPEIQFRLSETWLDEFEETSLRGDSDAERELARRVFTHLKEDQAQGLKMSRKFNVETLLPYAFEPSGIVKSPLNIVLVVNEMCASMCDIFTATLKDNNLATVVGSRTLGAGGNVVNHPYTPNSHMSVRVTESLIVRKDGSYIENNGVTPDVAVAVNEFATSKYEGVLAAANRTLTRGFQTPAATPAATPVVDPVPSPEPAPTRP